MPRGWSGAPRFYCGVPLITSEGLRMGSLCCIDSKPRDISPKVRLVVAPVGNRDNGVTFLVSLRYFNTYIYMYREICIIVMFHCQVKWPGLDQQLAIGNASGSETIHCEVKGLIIPLQFGLPIWQSSTATGSPSDKRQLSGTNSAYMMLVQFIVIVCQIVLYYDWLYYIMCWCIFVLSYHTVSYYVVFCLSWNYY